MKKKKEILLLAVLIVALSLYLVFRRTEQTHYRLPQLAPLKKEDVTRLEIRQGEKALDLEHRDGRWLILPEGYPADNSLVDAMLGSLVDLNLTALASETQNYSRYELDEAKRIVASAFNGDKLIRSINIGKAAPSFRHTFVQLPDDKRIYHAAENFRARFEKDAQALRDKQVMNVEGEVSELLLADGGTTLHILKNVEPAAPQTGGTEAAAPAAASADAAAAPEGKPAAPGTDKAGSPAQAAPGADQAKSTAQAAPPDGEPAAGQPEADTSTPPPPKWKTEDGRAVKEKDIDGLMSTFTNLKCDSFVPGKTKDDYQNPSYTVSLKTNKDYEFSVFDKEDNKYVCTSSESDYPFLLPEWRIKKIKLDLGGLIEE